MNNYPHLSTTFDELTFESHNGLEQRDPLRNCFVIKAPEDKTVHLGLSRVFRNAPQLFDALKLALPYVEADAAKSPSGSSRAMEAAEHAKAIRAAINKAAGIGP